MLNLISMYRMIYAIPNLKIQYTLGTPTDNLLAVWEDLLMYWQENPVANKYSNLKLSMFVDTGHPHEAQPKLKGRAHEVKSLMPALAHVWGARTTFSKNKNKNTN